MPKRIGGILSGFLLVAVSSVAQAQWTSRSEAGFVAARGNTSTETANAKFEIAREVDRWKHTFTASGLYGKTSHVATAQRWDAQLQTNHSFSERFFWFASVRYEDDRFSGFDYQGNASTGLGRKWLDTDVTKLSTQIGVGYRVLRPEELVRDDLNEVIARIPGDRQTDAVANGALKFEHALTESTKVTDSLLVESGRANTLARNDLALEVKITDVLALSLGYSVRRNSQPETGLRKTDTLMTVNLVYARPGV